MKKASVFVPMITILGMIVIAMAVFLTATNFSEPYELGHRQFKLYGAYQESENFLTYAEQALAHSVEHAVWHVAPRGGYFVTSTCGAYVERNVLCTHNTVGTQGVPNSFSADFNARLATYRTTIAPFTYPEELTLTFQNPQVLSAVGDGQKTTGIARSSNRIFRLRQPLHDSGQKEEEYEFTRKDIHVQASYEFDIVTSYQDIRDNVNWAHTQLIAMGDPRTDVQANAMILEDNANQLRWKHGACSTVDPLIQATYWLAEAVQDCALQAPNTCGCSGYDVSLVPANHHFLLHQIGSSTYVELVEDATSTVKKSVLILGNRLHEAQRFTCDATASGFDPISGFVDGNADCYNTGDSDRGPDVDCGTNLRSDEEHCGWCGNQVGTRFSCVAMQQICVPGEGRSSPAQCDPGDDPEGNPVLQHVPYYIGDCSQWACTQEEECTTCAQTDRQCLGGSWETTCSCAFGCTGTPPNCIDGQIVTCTCPAWCPRDDGNGGCEGFGCDENGQNCGWAWCTSQTCTTQDVPCDNPDECVSICTGTIGDCLPGTCGSLNCLARDPPANAASLGCGSSSCVGPDDVRPTGDECIPGTEKFRRCAYDTHQHTSNVNDGNHCQFVAEGIPLGTPLAPFAQESDFEDISYDHTKRLSTSAPVRIDSTTCSGTDWACEGNDVVLVKQNGEVGVLRYDSEDIYGTSGDGKLGPWPRCTTKDTWRFCVESMDTYPRFDGDQYVREPIQHMFAVRLSDMPNNAPPTPPPPVICGGFQEQCCEGATCNSPLDQCGLDNVCRGADGRSCTSDDECVGVCDVDTCVAVISCGGFQEQCCPGGSCNSPLDGCGSDNVCRGKDGKSCSGSDNECLGTCDVDTCINAPPPPSASACETAGFSCTGATECSSGLGFEVPGLACSISGQICCDFSVPCGGLFELCCPSGAACDPGMSCSTGNRCRLQSGESCTDNSQCISGICPPGDGFCV